MGYSTDIAVATDAMYELFGVSCAYTGQDAAVTVTAIIEHDLAQYGDVFDVSGMTATVSVRISEKADIPRRGDKYTIGGKVYVIDSPVRADTVEHVMLVA
jgi:hypothetical protein